MSLQSYYHRVLGLPSNATGEEVKQAYKAMALRWHPDRHPDNTEDATRRFLEVQNAYRALTREHYQRLDSALPSPINRRTDSASTYKTGTCFSGSTSSLGSFIRVSASSADSLVTPASTVNTGTSPQGIYPAQFSNRRAEPAVVSHPPLYANDDHSQRASSKPLSPSPGRLRSRHSSDNIRQHPSAWNNYTLPTLHKYSAAQQPRESCGCPFSIIPPARRDRVAQNTATSWDYYNIHECQQAVPLQSLGIGPSREWTYSLSLTLEELLTGKHCCFSLSRKIASGAIKNVILEVDIPPGCREGTRILCRGVGHELKEGTRQDIAFIVQELNHQRFSRVYDDLTLDVTIPLDDSLRYKGGDFVVEGLDRQGHRFHIDYPRSRALKGRCVITGAGMPIRRGGQVVGRGNLIIRWEIISPHPKVFGFMRRFMNFRR